MTRAGTFALFLLPGSGRRYPAKGREEGKSVRFPLSSRKKASADCGYVSKAPASIVYEDFAWERYYDLSSAEIGELIRFPKMGEGLVGQMRRNLSTKLGVSTLDSFEMSDGD